MREKKLTAQQQKLQMEILRIHGWIEALEERTLLLLAFTVEDLTPGEREAAVPKYLTLIGRFTELKQNFELQLHGPGREEDDPEVVADIISGKNELIVDSTIE